MKPVTPVIPGSNAKEVVYAKDQPEYIPLPAIRGEDGTVTTRWKLTLRERLVALFFGDVYLSIMTFNERLQPVRLSIDVPQDVIAAVNL